MTLFLSVLTMTLLAVNAFASETKELDAKGLTHLNVRNPSGEVEISAGDGPRAIVTFDKKKFDETCKLTIERVGTKLGVIVEDTGFTGSSDCQVDFDIRVPKKSKLDLALGTGDVKIKGIESSLGFKMGSGSVTGDGRFDEVDGKTGTGSVKLTGLTGGGRLVSGAGSVNLTYARAPLKGALEIEVASGDAQIVFPKGSKVQSTLVSVLGEASNELGETPNANFKVSMKAAAGSLKIKAQ